jgi:3-dehydroquinate dehydratase-2
MAKILVINGPNLNLLGSRETELYGDVSLKEIEKLLVKHTKAHQVECFHSNAEDEIINKIQACPSKKIRVIILNAGALAHTSIAIRDALLAVKLPFYEVHLTNIFARESFRHHSFLSDIATGVVCGLGVYGYIAALDAAIDLLKDE